MFCNINTQRNSWKHTFSILTQCGKRSAGREFLDNPEYELYLNEHCNKLRTRNNRRIVCGGLQWDMYIHPNQGENRKEFALSAFPVKSSAKDKLPDNYKLRYTVSTSLNTRNDDDQKSLNQFDHTWTREISDIIYDANPKDIAMGDGNKLQIDWRSTMEKLSFSTDDLYSNNCDEDGWFELCISIQTEFIRQKTKKSQYNGVLGAILVCFLMFYVVCPWPEILSF